MYTHDELAAEIKAMRAKMREEADHMASRFQALVRRIDETGTPHLDGVALAEGFARYVTACAHHSMLIAVRDRGSFGATGAPLQPHQVARSKGRGG